jgi:hypothetical protein
MVFSQSYHNSVSGWTTGRSHLKPFSRSNPCPICEGGADCRYSTDEELILCHGHIDFDPNHPNWRFVKPASTGVWGVFAPRKDERFDRNQWLEQKAERELRAKREKEARALASLPIEERDKAIRGVSSYIGLSRRHRQALLDRGLTDEQIEAGLFFSVNKGDRVPAGTPANLAGVVNGKIAASLPGYACISFDRHGHATGWQTRLDNTTDGNKYRWAKGTHDSHLPNDELPITVINPTGDKSLLWLTEGILKPFVSAHKHVIACLGASGGWFHKAELQVKEAIVEYRELVIVPDAGDVANRQVMMRWRDQIAFLESLGKSVLVAWWEQRTKDDDDIDELENLDSIEFISPKDFFALAVEKLPFSVHKKKLSLIEKLIKRARQFKGFGEKPTIGKVKSIDFIPDSVEQWESLGCPEIEYTGNPAKIWHEAMGKGFRAILDGSFMGSGKSHGVLSIGGPNPDRQASQRYKIWYISNEHRNPSIKAIADQFTDLVPRSRYGFCRDVDGKLMHGIEGQTVEIEGNCIRADLFKTLSNMGYSPDEKDGKLNPICQSCPKANFCGITPGLYRFERRETLKSPYIRSSIESMPREGYDFSTDVLVIEEASRELNPTRIIETSHEKLLIELDRVRSFVSPKAYSYLDSFVQSLKPLYTEKSKYGHEVERIKEALPSFEDIDSLIAILEANSVDLEKIFEESDKIEGLGRSDYKKYKELIKYTNRELGKENYKETIDKLEKLPPNGLIYLLKLARGDQGIVARLNSKHLTLTIENRWYKPIFDTSRCVIFLDATATAERIKLLTGIDRPILTMRKKVDRPLANLTVHQIEVSGLGSNVISDTAINRVKAVLDKLGETAGEIPIICHKAYREALKGIGHWFKDNRSSNDFEGAENLAFVGSPFPNIGAVKDEYRALAGSLDGFDDYYGNLILAEQLQGIGGRQRCHRYPDKQFHVWAIGSNLDLDWLSEYGATVDHRHGFEYTPEAGDRSQLAMWDIIEVIRTTGAQSGRAIAKILGQSVGAVNKFFREHQIDLKGLIDKLITPDTDPIDTNIGRVSGHQDILDDEYFRCLFGLDAIALAEEMMMAIAEYGWETFRDSILPIFPSLLQVKILSTLCGLGLAIKQ